MYKRERERECWKCIFGNKYLQDDKDESQRDGIVKSTL